MKQKKQFLLVTALCLTLGACAGAPPEPPSGQLGQRVETLHPDELPPELPSCAELYGDVQDWPWPEAVVGLHGLPDQWVLIDRDSPDCTMPSSGLRALARDLNVAPLSLTGGTEGEEVANPAGDSNPLPASPDPGKGNSERDGEVNDSNPLPAKPDSNPDDRSTRAPRDNSKPKPATGVDTGNSPDESATAEDSNPLPARATSGIGDSDVDKD